MKKSDWLFAILIIGMGLLCLIISATSFRGLHFLQFGLSMRTLCMAMISLSVIIGLVYYFIDQKNRH
ncbi:hypothetical protein [Fontibacillus sp. BL9]|uniref:hypothetical protein n=1 Tax=Fontibacillus sp. BL9 TaxID=3389971 RepID=UPI00397845AB